MLTMKRRFTLAMLLTTVVAGACGTSAVTPSPTPNSPTNAPGTISPATPAASPTAPAKHYTIGFAVSTLANPFFVTAANAAKVEAAAKGETLLVTDGANAQATQTTQIEDFIAQKVDAIIINPIDSNGAVAAVKEANDANIPVILFLRKIGTGATSAALLLYDNVALGKLDATDLFTMLAGTGKVAVLTGIPGLATATDRTTGIHQALTAFPGINVVSEQTAQFDRATASTVMENIFQAHPDITGIVSENDEMTLGAIAALKSAGVAPGKIKITSNDATADGLAAVKAGWITKDNSIDVGPMAVTAVDYAITVAGGGTITQTYVAPPFIGITSANVDQYLTAASPSPK